MARIVNYSELLDHGAGKYVRDLTDGYIVVSNQRVSERSFILMKARRLSEIFDKAGMIEERDDIENALDVIKEKNEEAYKVMRGKKGTK